MLNAAIIGLGRWGKRLVDSVQHAGTPLGETIRFTRAIVPMPEKVRDYADAQGLALSNDLGAALKDPAVAAMVITSPHDQHAGQLMAAARSGKHVFVEKPFTLTRASAAAAVDAARAAGIVLALGHNRRFLPAMQALKALVASGELGAIVHLDANFSGPFGQIYRAGTWRSLETGAAAGLTAMGIHLFDGFIHLAGPIAEVRCTSARRLLTSDVDDTVMATLRLESGASAAFSTILTTARQWRLQVFGSTGWAHMLDHHILEVYASNGLRRTTAFPNVDIERAELEAFAEATAGGPAYPLPLDEAVHGIAVLEALIASAAGDGGKVEVER